MFGLEKTYVFLLILLTGSVYIALGFSALFFLSLLVLLIIYVRNYGKSIKKKLLVSCLFGLGFLFSSLCIHYVLVPLSNDWVPYLNFFFKTSIVILFLLHLKNSNIDFVHLLNRVLKFISFHALVAFFISFFVTSYLFRIQTDDFYTNSFLYVFFYNSKFNVFGLELYRNQGIFWEPGILQMYMNILFFISSFLVKNKKFQVISALIILTTYSTTGIGILIIQFLVYFFSIKLSIVKKLTVFLLAAAITFPIFIINSHEKLSDNATTDVSSSVLRLYDLQEGYSIMKNYPFTGIGLSITTYQAVKRASTPAFFSAYSQDFIDIVLKRKSSNSVLYFLSRFGIIVTALWLIFLYKQDLFKKKRSLFLILILIFNFSEPLLLDSFFLLIAGSGLLNLFQFKTSSLTA